MSESGAAVAPRALCVSSAVASGYVGINAARFALQELGFEVLAVPTVLFSSHTARSGWRGRALPPEHVSELLDGLAAQGLLADVSLVLSGYLGRPENAAAVAQAVRHVRALNPAVRYVCDPVLGNRAAGSYVAAGVRDAVRDELVPLADVLTPNHYELELLTGVADPGLALTRLCGDSRIAVVTSAEDARIPADRVGLLLYGGDRVRLATTPRLGVPTHGAGDLTAALFAGQLTRGLDPEAALSATVRAVTRVLRTPRQDPWELPLVAARHELTGAAGTIGSGEDELRWES